MIRLRVMDDEQFRNEYAQRDDVASFSLQVEGFVRRLFVPVSRFIGA